MRKGTCRELLGDSFSSSGTGRVGRLDVRAELDGREDGRRLTSRDESGALEGPRSCASSSTGPVDDLVGETGCVGSRLGSGRRSESNFPIPPSLQGSDTDFCRKGSGHKSL